MYPHLPLNVAKLGWTTILHINELSYTTSPPTSTLKVTCGPERWRLTLMKLNKPFSIFGPLCNLNLKNLTPKFNVLRFPVKLSTADHPLKIEENKLTKNQHIHCIIHAAMKVKRKDDKASYKTLRYASKKNPSSIFHVSNYFLFFTCTITFKICNLYYHDF